MRPVSPALALVFLLMVPTVAADDAGLAASDCTSHQELVECFVARLADVESCAGSVSWFVTCNAQNAQDAVIWFLGQVG